MKNIIYILLIVLLLGIVGYQGYVIAGAKNKENNAANEGYITASNMPAELEKLPAEIDNKFNADVVSTGKMLDKYFNEDFFKTGMEPFKQMQAFHDRMIKKFEHETQNMFGKSWDNWYKQKFEMSGITSSISQTNDKLVMIFKIPDVDNRKIKVDINGKSIDIEYDAKKTEESKNKQNESYSSMQEHMQKILPLPTNVDAAKAKIDAKEDELTITFPKKG